MWPDSDNLTYLSLPFGWGLSILNVCALKVKIKENKKHLFPVRINGAQPAIKDR